MWVLVNKFLRIMEGERRSGRGGRGKECVYVYVCVCMYVRACVCVCVCVYVCVDHSYQIFFYEYALPPYPFIFSHPNYQPACEPSLLLQLTHCCFGHRFALVDKPCGHFEYKRIHRGSVLSRKEIKWHCSMNNHSCA